MCQLQEIPIKHPTNTSEELLSDANLQIKNGEKEKKKKKSCFVSARLQLITSGLCFNKAKFRTTLFFSSRHWHAVSFSCKRSDFITLMGSDESERQSLCRNFSCICRWNDDSRVTLRLIFFYVSHAAVSCIRCDVPTVFFLPPFFLNSSGDGAKQTQPSWDSKLQKLKQALWNEDESQDAKKHKKYNKNSLWWIQTLGKTLSNMH